MRVGFVMNGEKERDQRAMRAEGSQATNTGILMKYTWKGYIRALFFLHNVVRFILIKNGPLHVEINHVWLIV